MADVKNKKSSELTLFRKGTIKDFKQQMMPGVSGEPIGVQYVERLKTELGTAIE